MIPTDPKDILILRSHRNTELEKYIMDEYNGDISFLYNKREPNHKSRKNHLHIKNFFLYITGRK
jgi:hypothetical protein